MMCNITPNDLADLAYEYGLKVRSYSGRGMHSRPCFAITGDASAPMKLAVGVAVDMGAGDDADYLADRMQVDSLGLGQVFYWPGIEAPTNVGD